MRKRRLLILLALTFNFMACNQTNQNELGGDDVTQQFLSEYSGSYQEQGSDLDGDGERMIIERDGKIEVFKHRQVGSDGNPAIPKPTYCSFSMTGQIAVVVQLGRDGRTDVTNEGAEFIIPQTHKMVFLVDEVKLNDELRSGSTTDTGCVNFQDKMNNKLPVYTYGLELFGSGTIRLHTRDDGDYDGSRRTDSTLDEVFVRQSL